MEKFTTRQLEFAFRTLFVFLLLTCWTVAFLLPQVKTLYPSTREVELAADIAPVPLIDVRPTLTATPASKKEPNYVDLSATVTGSITFATEDVAGLVQTESRLPRPASGESDRRGRYHELVQNYVEAGKAQYDKGYFEQAVKTFQMAEGYQEYLTPAGREQLSTLTKEAQTAVAERKCALETFATINRLIKQDQLIEARIPLESLSTNECLTENERTQITEVLKQIDAQIAVNKTRSATVEGGKLGIVEKLEKIAEQVRTPAEQQNDQNKRIAELYRDSMRLYRSGQFKEARKGLAEVAASGLVPPAMKKTIESYITGIDKGLAKVEPTLKATPAPKKEPKYVDLSATLTGSATLQSGLEVRQQTLRQLTRAQLCVGICQYMEGLATSGDRAATSFNMARMTLEEVERHKDLLTPRECAELAHFLKAVRDASFKVAQPPLIEEIQNERSGTLRL